MKEKERERGREVHCYACHLFSSFFRNEKPGEVKYTRIHRLLLCICTPRAGFLLSTLSFFLFFFLLLKKCEKSLLTWGFRGGLQRMGNTVQVLRSRIIIY